MTTTTLRSTLRKSRVLSLILLIVSAAAFYFAATLQQEPGDTVSLSFASPRSQTDSSNASSSTAKSASPFQEALQSLRSQIDKDDPFDLRSAENWANTARSLETFTESESGEIRKQISALAALDKKLAVIRPAASVVVKDMEGLIGRGGPLFKGFVAEGSPFEQMAATLELLKPDFVALAAKKPVENMKAFQVNLKALTENRAKLNDPGMAPQFNDRRRAIIEKIDASGLMRSAKEWESTVFAYLARIAEIRRLADQALKPAESASADVASATEIDRETLFRILVAVGVVSLIASIALVLRSDQNVLDVLARSSSGRESVGSAAAQSVVENLPYLQIAAKQSAELGRQVAASLKKLVKTALASAHARPEPSVGSHPGRVQVTDAELNQNLETLNTILRDYSVLKERAIQLSIAVNQAIVDPKVHDLVDHFSESIEHAEARMSELRERFSALGRSAGSIDVTAPPDIDPQSELRAALSRDAEGLLVAVSQWSRQFDRLTETLHGLEQGLASPGSDLARGSD